MSMKIFNKQDYIFRGSLDIIKTEQGYIEYTSQTKSKIVEGKNNSSLLKYYTPELLSYWDKRSEKYLPSIRAGRFERNFLYSSIIMDNPYIEDIFLSDVDNSRDKFDCVIKGKDGLLYIIELKVRYFSSDRYDGDLIMKNKYNDIINISHRNGAIPIYLMYFTGDNVLRIYNLDEIECEFNNKLMVNDCVGCSNTKIILTDNIPPSLGITKKIKKID